MADSGQQECIYLYYIPSDGGSWANFLHEKLNEDDYMLSSSLVDISTLENDHLIHDVNIILVSPDFLNLKSLQPLTVLHQIRSLVVLLGVDKPEYEMFVKDNESNLSKWDVFETEATEKSVRQLLLRIISLYETSHPDEVHKHSAHIYYGSGEEEDYSTPSETRSKAEYAITPLVRESQASFSSSVTSSSVTESEYDVPLSRVDSYYDSPQFCSVDDYDVPPVTRPKSAMSFNSSDACYKSEKANNEVYRVLHHFTDEAQEVYILLNREACDEVMLVSDDGHIEELKLLNKNMFQVKLKVPGQKYKIKEGNNVLGEIDTESFKKAHAQSKVEMIKELLLDETDPIALLCTSLGIPRKTSNSLDSFLEAKCKCPNIAKSLLEKFTSAEQDKFSKDSSDEECPTLLHFCSEYNLVRFCEALLDMPGMSKLCNKRNKRHETALQVAKRNNFTGIIRLIETKVNEARDSGCSSDCDFVASKTNLSNDIYENQESFENKDSEDLYVKPEGYQLEQKPVFSYKSVENKKPVPKQCQSDYRQMGNPVIPATKTTRGRDSGKEGKSVKATVDPFPELSKKHNDSPVKEKRETSLSRESDYLPMDQKDLSQRESYYMAMDPQEEAPPIPPKACKTKSKCANQLLPEDVFKYPSYSVCSEERDSIYEKPINQGYEKQHLHSESEACNMYNPNSGKNAREREFKSASLPQDDSAIYSKYHKEKRSKSLPGDIQLPAHLHKTHNPIKKLFQAFHHGHDEEQHEHNARHRRNSTKGKIIHPIQEENAQNETKRRGKKNKKGNRTERRKSIRIIRLMEDQNIKVLSLPEKKTQATQREKSEMF